ncbi:unnamed protein product [Closterium sp. NIES-65]|nr:unnamed protein product [Closterium sp. NIES-65]
MPSKLQEWLDIPPGTILQHLPTGSWGSLSEEESYILLHTLVVATGTWTLLFLTLRLSILSRVSFDFCNRACGEELMACLWLVELSNPFMHAREMLRELDAPKSALTFAVDKSAKGSKPSKESSKPAPAPAASPSQGTSPDMSNTNVFEFGSASVSEDKSTLAGYCPVSDDLEPCRWEVLPSGGGEAPRFRIIF